MAPADIFDFFGLSRELRDMIYDELFTDSKPVAWPDQDEEVSIIACRITKPHVYRISQQSTFELCQRKARSAETILLEDHMINLETYEINVPDCLKSFRHVHISLGSICADNQTGTSHECGLLFEIEYHKRWVSHCLSQLRDLRSVSVTVHVQAEGGPEECARNFRMVCESLPDLRCLIKVEVRLVHSGRWEYSAGGKLMYSLKPRYETSDVGDKDDGGK